LALAPPLFALMTWQTRLTYLPSRTYALPIVAAEVAVILLAAAAGFRPLAAFGQLSRLAQWSLLAWLSVVAIAAFGAAVPRGALIEAAMTLLQAAFCLALWNRFCLSWRAFIPIFYAAIAAGAVGYGIVAHIAVIAAWEVADFPWIGFGVGVSNVRQIGFYGIALMGIALGMLRSGSPQARRWWWAALVLGYYLVVWSGGRAAFGAALATSAVALLLVERTRRGTAAGMLGALLLALLMGLVVVPDPAWGTMAIIGRSVDTGTEDYSSGRWDMWAQALAALPQAAWFGHGQGQFRFLVPAALHSYNHPHNAVIQFLYQWGFLGTVALGLSFCGLARRLPSLAKANPLSLPAVFLLTGMISMSMLEGNFYHQYPIMVSLVCVAALGALARRADAEVRPSEA
jgi:O-antigen ligase